MKDQIQNILKGLPDHMRWNILEDEGYFGDEWDNWGHMTEEELWEYFKKIFGVLKQIKDLVE